MNRNAVAWAALVVSIAALVGSRTYTKPATAVQDIPAEGQKTAEALSAAFNAVAEYVSPSVVQINTESRGMRLGGRGGGQGEGQRQGPGDRQIPEDLQEMLKRFFGDQLPEGFEIRPQQDRQPFRSTGTGSGFVYDDQGRILTNAHVVEGAEKIVVTFHDGVRLPAKIIGTYPQTDVAVIQVDATSYPPLKVGDSKGLKVGEWVLAIGSPFGLDRSVTAGIISALGRDLGGDVLGTGAYEAFIQTDAAVNPGNSGGPLVNMHGRVIGLNSAIATASRSNSGVGFAVPVDIAKRIADKLIRDGEIKPLLMGITIEPVDRALARQLGLPESTRGVLVTDVGKDTPAEKAGLKVGDVIVGYDGQSIDSRPGLQYLVRTSDAGQSYTLIYLRGGQRRETTVTPAAADSVAARLGRALQGPGARPEPEPEPEPEPAKPAIDQTEIDGFGFAVSPLTPELAEAHSWNEDAQGVVVTEVDPDGPASAAGMEVGDLITRTIHDKAISNVTSVDDLKALTASDEIAVYVEDVNKRLPGQFMALKKVTSED